MAPTHITIGRTGDFVEVADAKDAAGQRQWERARDVAVRFATEPTTAVGAKLLAIIGRGSNLGDPTDENWLPNLPPGHRVAVLGELQQLVSSWHLESGCTTDGTRVDTVKAAFSAAAALRLAATQAGPGRGEPLAKAAVAERRTRELAKAAATRGGSAKASRIWRRSEDGQVHQLNPDGTVVGTSDLLAPAMLLKAAGADTIKAAIADRVKTAIADAVTTAVTTHTDRVTGRVADAVKAGLAPLESQLTQLDRRVELEERRIAAAVASRPPAGADRRATETDGLRARAAEYRALASVPGMAPPDVATLERAADALERQAG